MAVFLIGMIKEKGENYLWTFKSSLAIIIIQDYRIRKQIEQNKKIKKEQHITALQCRSSGLWQKQQSNKLSIKNYKVQQMLKQQISPWTIYDQNGNKMTFQQKAIIQEQKKPKIKQELKKVQRKEVKDDEILREPSPPKTIQVNELMNKINLEKKKLNNRLNELLALQIIKSQLLEQNNPIAQIKLHLPKLKEISKKEGELNGKQDSKKNKNERKHYYSQKLSLISQFEDVIMDDFSKIFVSKSLNPTSNKKNDNPNSYSDPIKPQFPKYRKNKSVLIPYSSVKNQFNDKSLRDALLQESGKKYYVGRKNTVFQLLYGFNH